MSAVLWRASDGGSDLCVLEPAGRGRRLRGTVLTHEAGQPVEIRHAVTGDAAWATRDVEMLVTFGAAELHEPVELGALWSGRERLPELQGCLDVDLAFAPATNTLPIRWLGLQFGGEAEVAVAWLRWPELRVERAVQRYTRLGKDRYRFAQAEFTAELLVDERGLVLDYEGLWRRGRARVTSGPLLDFSALCEEFVGHPSNGGSEAARRGIDWLRRGEKRALDERRRGACGGYPQDPQRGGEERDWSR